MIGTEPPREVGNWILETFEAYEVQQEYIHYRNSIPNWVSRIALKFFTTPSSSKQEFYLMITSLTVEKRDSLVGLIEQELPESFMHLFSGLGFNPKENEQEYCINICSSSSKNPDSISIALEILATSDKLSKNDQLPKEIKEFYQNKIKNKIKVKVLD